MACSENVGTQDGFGDGERSGDLPPQRRLSRQAVLSGVPGSSGRRAADVKTANRSPEDHSSNDTTNATTSMMRLAWQADDGERNTDGERDTDGISPNARLSLLARRSACCDKLDQRMDVLYMYKLLQSILLRHRTASRYARPGELSSLLAVVPRRGRCLRNVGIASYRSWQRIHRQNLLAQ